MKLFVEIQGTLQQCFSSDKITLSLKDRAHCKDMLLALEQMLHPEAAQSDWNFEQHAFRDPVLIINNGVSIWDMEMPLFDNQTIVIKRYLVKR